MLRTLLLALALLASAGWARGAAIVIDTMPTTLPAPGSGPYVSGAWNEWAIGFEVPVAVVLSSISTTLRFRDDDGGAFTFGLADGSLIGNPTQNYSDAPPGSIAEWQC